MYEWCSRYDTQPAILHLMQAGTEGEGEGKNKNNNAFEIIS